MAQQQPKQAQPQPTTTPKGTAMQQPPKQEPLGLSRAEWGTPFSAMRSLMEEMDRFFGGGFGSMTGGTPSAWIPQVEAFEQEGKLVFRADVPGMARDDLHVEVADDELVVWGERKQEEQQTRRGTVYSERRYGSFERRFALPPGCDPNAIDARFDNGVLEISLPMPKQIPSRKTVEIGAGPSPKDKSDPGSVH